MIILKIDATRFYAEYQQYIQKYARRHIDWFVDEFDLINMFIITDKGFGYICKLNKDTIPPLLKTAIVKEGAILGILDDKKEVSKIIERVIPSPSAGYKDPDS